MWSRRDPTVLGPAYVAMRRRRDRAVRRSLVVLVSLTVAVAAVLTQRLGPNPALPEAEALIERLQAAHDAVDGGVLPVGSSGRLEPGAPVALDAALTSRDPAGEDLRASRVALRSGVDLQVVVGEAAGDCYALAWEPGGQRWARVLARSLPCEPGPIVTSMNEYSYLRQTPLFSWHLRVPAPFQWSDVLPEPIHQRVWVLPVALVLSVAGIRELARLSVVLLTGSADPPAA